MSSRNNIEVYYSRVEKCVS